MAFSIFENEIKTWYTASGSFDSLHAWLQFERRSVLLTKLLFQDMGEVREDVSFLFVFTHPEYAQ